MDDERDTQHQELSGYAQARWDALKDVVGELVGAVDDADAFTAALAAMRQIGQGTDLQEIVNAVHVPDDAGEYAQALRRMLVRIPDGWGRWIGCSRGWYAIVVDLDQQLGALFPGYELHQVKEKYGGLRFYWGTGERVTDPRDPEPGIPSPSRQPAEDKTSAAWDEWEAAYDTWSRRLALYLGTEEGAARQVDLENRSELAERLVEAAEQRASVTCELCGLSGELCCAPGRHPWYQTLCAGCAQERGPAQVNLVGPSASEPPNRADAVSQEGRRAADGVLEAPPCGLVKRRSWEATRGSRGDLLRIRNKPQQPRVTRGWQWTSRRRCRQQPRRPETRLRARGQTSPRPSCGGQLRSDPPNSSSAGVQAGWRACAIPARTGPTLAPSTTTDTMVTAAARPPP
ncbi:MAG TPA: hypothetical protein VMF57_03780 [Solirubrobacteraceae bacterium]|nr:hypothetical protein [Solirubrobacteraceae bacterium]